MCAEVILSSAADVVHAGLAAHVAGAWRGLVALIDSRSLNRWTSGFIRGNTHVASLEEMQSQFPHAPREALATFVERETMAKRRFVARLADHIAGVHTLDELATLPPREVLVRVLEAGDDIDRVNRTIAAAYAAPGIERPAETHHSRPNRQFEIVREFPVSTQQVDVVFRERDESSADETTWRTRRDRRGRWWLVMSPRLLYLPGGTAWIIDDPVVVAYLQRER